MSILVVNAIPNSLSDETNRDAEPSIAVNPANPLQIALSAFTPDPATPGTAPIFRSLDGGHTWDLVPMLPGGNFTGDTSLRFGTSSNVLYAGILREHTLEMNILRGDLISGVLMTTLVDRVNEDQPYVEAMTVPGGSGAGLDRVFVGHNDLNMAAGNTATVETSFDASTAPAPAGFSPGRLEARSTSGPDNPSVRPAIHPTGVVYAAFVGIRRILASGVSKADVVVVRDDNWGIGPSAFTALKDSADGQQGHRVAKVMLPVFRSLLGTQRVGSQLAIAVDPRDSNTVYVAWADGSTAAAYTVHLRRSTDGGETWSPDLRTIGPATNPALSINIRGKVAFLYQQFGASVTLNRWATHVELSDDGFSTLPDDFVLANVPDLKGDYTGDNPLGDYAGLMSVGKDFYGAFSAFNEPVPANFPQGVTYQRNVNWTTRTLLGKDGVTTVNASIDPFFFKVSDIDAAEDFYVRDWTDNPSSGDQGLEPSTHPDFHVSSDVWNRRSTLPGGFANDQPENQDAGSGLGSVGDNWAFARIRRNAPAAAGTGAKTVAAHFLVSKFGTGSNYVDAGSADPNISFLDPDPTVAFNPADVGPLVTPPCHWHLRRVASTHLCLAVEISAPGDPFVAPSLVGNAPGWPTSDLRIVSDNNRAQRNLSLSTSLAKGGRLNDDFYAIVHNASTHARRMKLQVAVDPSLFKRLRGARVGVVGGGNTRLTPGMTIALPRMQPAENRWLRISFTPPNGREGEVVPIHVFELVNGTVVNGFAVGVRLASAKAAARDVLRKHRNLLVRLEAGFGMRFLEDDIEATLDLTAGSVRESAYLKLVRDHVHGIGRATRQLLAKHARPGEQFGLRTALRRLAAGAESRVIGNVVVAHDALLNAFDSFLTMLQLANGDSADVLQNVRWQQRLYMTVPALIRLKGTPALLERSDRFIRGYGERKVTNRDYLQLAAGLMECYEQTARSSSAKHLGLRRHVTGIMRGLENVARLQQAHRHFLLTLQKLDRPR